MKLSALKVFHNTLSDEELKVVNKVFKQLKKIPKSNNTILDIKGYLGQGSFASVFEISPDKVVRIESNLTTINGECELSGYSDWIKLVAIKNRSKYFPKVYFHADKFEDEDSYCAVTVLEKLIPLDDKYSTELWNADVFSSEGKIQETPLVRSFGVRELSLSRAKNLIKSVGLSPDDLGCENCMIRPLTNQLVITDPCY